MRHGSKKIKIRVGKDANAMLMRKLATNFFMVGKITTTEKKAKTLKTHLERLVEKTKSFSESNKNYLLRNLGNQELVQTLFSNVGPVVAGRVGGYVKMQKLYDRDSDGTLMIKLEWTTPIVIEEKKIVKEKIVKEKVPVQEK